MVARLWYKMPKNLQKMKTKKSELGDKQRELFYRDLEDLLGNTNHPLIILSKAINWVTLEEEVRKLGGKGCL